MKFVTQDYYEILNVAPEATNEQVKRAYRMVRQSFRPDSMAIHSLYSDAETEAISAKIDEAFQILSNPESARRYSRYHRTAASGASVPRDPDAFFDAVHQLDESSPIEELARQVGRGDTEPVTEASSGLEEARQLRPATQSSADVVAHAEVFIDSLDIVQDNRGTEFAVHQGGRVASASAGDLIQARDRSVELLTTGPVANPDASILSDVSAPSTPQVASQGAVSVAVAMVPETEESGREMITQTVRKQVRGPLEIEPLPVETLEAIEMDCGGINGMFMQQVRRELGISIEDISVRTKIGKGMLNAIEQEDQSYFQARVYMKGYLRQVCRLLHLPVREVPERYVEALGID